MANGDVGWLSSIIRNFMTYSISRHAALSSLALAIATPSAFAQTSAEPAIDPIIITATRTPQLASSVLSDTVLIGPEEIARSGAESITDLLQRQSGIEVSSNGGAGTTSNVYLRGANGNQNVVLVDGVRIGSSTTGAANWSAIPLSAVDHIEIVYGPLSTLYGADAIGGVIQIFTKQGAGTPRVSATAGVGSYNLRTYDASVTGATEGDHPVRYAFSLGKAKSDGFSATTPANTYNYNPDKDGYNKDSAAGQVALQLAKGQEVGLVFLQSRLNAQYDDGATADPRTIQKLDTLAIFSKNQVLPIWASQVQLGQSQDKENDSTYGSINTKQTDITWQNDIKVGVDTLQVLFDHRKEQVASDSTPALTGERNTNSVAASYNLKRDAQLVSFSLRDDDSSQYGSKATGAVAYGYRFSSALRASASYGTSFRAPSFNELYYPGYGTANLKPESGHNLETGLYFNDGTSQLSAVYYHNQISDLIVYASPCPTTPTDDTSGCAYNVNRALLEGLTVSARRQFGPVNLSGSVDFQDPRDETTGLQLARRAKQHANFTSEYGAGALKGGLELQLSGRRFDGYNNSTTLGGYGVLNLFATYQVAADWSILARWNNAANKQYELANGYATAGSNLFAALRYNMK